MRRLLLLFLLALPLAAQEKLVESIEVRVTNIDVVVTDAKGNPISGLTKDDFELLENGRPQTITNFYEVRPRSVNVASPSPAASAEEAVYVEAPQELRRRRIIFFIDMYSIEPFRRNEMLASIEKAFDQLLQPGDEASIVTWNRRVKIVTPFTSDRLMLRDAFDELRSQAAGTSLSAERNRVRENVLGTLDAARFARTPIEQAYTASIGIVRNYAESITASEKAIANAMSIMLSSLAGVEGKKVMVFAGAQLPEYPALEMFQWVDNTYAPLVRGVIPWGMREASAFSMAKELRKVAKQANANGITMYLIDGSGNTGGGDPTAERIENNDPALDFLEYSNSANAFSAIARETGGIALTRTNNFDYALRTVARDLNAYYSLGYRSDRQEGPAERDVVVKVKRPEFRVRSRRSYVAKSSDEQMVDRVVANLFQSSMKNELAIGVEIGKPVKKDRNTFAVPVTVTVPWDLTLLPEGDNLVGGFTVFIAAGDGEGSLSPVAKKVQTVRFPAQIEPVMKKKPLIFNAEVVLRKGEQYLSVAVVDQITSSSGFARTKVVAR